MSYRLCDACGFWFLPDPFWLEEAYSDAISALDTGAVERNLRTLRSLALPLRMLSRARPVVDWAGGVGLLTRLLRDLGFDAYWQDAYARNVFAQGFEWDATRGPAGAVLAVEVLEHTTDPVAFIDECLGATGARNLIFTQLRYVDVDPTWWYLAPQSGQHISFYSDRTLAAIADRLHLRLHSAGQFHLLTDRYIPSASFQLLVSISRRLPTRLLGKRRRIWEDHLDLARRAGVG